VSEKPDSLTGDPAGLPTFFLPDPCQRRLPPTSAGCCKQPEDPSPRSRTGCGPGGFSRTRDRSTAVYPTIAEVSQPNTLSCPPRHTRSAWAATGGGRRLCRFLAVSFCAAPKDAQAERYELQAQQRASLAVCPILPAWKSHYSPHLRHPAVAQKIRPRAEYSTLSSPARGWHRRTDSHGPSAAGCWDTPTRRHLLSILVLSSARHFPGTQRPSASGLLPSSSFPSSLVPIWLLQSPLCGAHRPDWSSRASAERKYFKNLLSFPPSRLNPRRPSFTNIAPRYAPTSFAGAEPWWRHLSYVPWRTYRGASLNAKIREDMRRRPRQRHANHIALLAQ